MEAIVHMYYTTEKFLEKKPRPRARTGLKIIASAIANVDCSQLWIFSYFYLIVEHLLRVYYELIPR